MATVAAFGLLGCAVLLLWAVGLAIGAAVVTWAWGMAMVPLFGWPQIEFWQAFALLVLIRMLFGGLAGHSRSQGSHS